jgi:hypothetical protein
LLRLNTKFTCHASHLLRNESYFWRSAQGVRNFGRQEDTKSNGRKQESNHITYKPSTTLSTTEVLADDASWRVTTARVDSSPISLLLDTEPWIAWPREQIGRLLTPSVYECVSYLSTNHQCQDESLEYFCLALPSPNGNARSD